MKEILISSNLYVCKPYQEHVPFILAERDVVEFKGLFVVRFDSRLATSRCFAGSHTELQFYIIYHPT
jgi:hypothetical protein